MPNSSGLVFIVVTHRPAEQPSLLPELLARKTQMPVAVVGDGARLEPDHVYLSLPGNNVALLHGAIQLMDASTQPRLHLPIDYFFSSLARDQQERAICIVLSGTGSDGTLGLRAIKAEGGMAMVQDEVSAHYGGMPRSAAETLLADYILSPDRMPMQLVAYKAAAGALRSGADVVASELARELPKIFVLLRDRLGHDFNGYKLNTVLRRIERRMRVHELARASAYVQMLQTEPHELDLLFQELLITVTHFFRDPGAFEALEQRLTDLLNSRLDRPLRIWVPGCATGEEPYSIAMLALEVAERLDRPMHLQIFATDLDSRAVAIARHGRYPAGIAADVGAERLRKFFVGDVRGYRVSKRVRDCIVFATHNLLRDPPFTKVDLLACRNVLIYLTDPLQQNLFPLFHYALNPGGFLWLGTSETVPSTFDFFVVSDRKWKLYSRSGSRDGVRSALTTRTGSKFEQRASTALQIASEPQQRRSEAASVALNVKSMLIDRFAPATVLVSERGEIAYIHGRTGAYLEPSMGEPKLNLFAMAREGLRLCLHSAVRQAAVDDREIIHRRVPVKIPGGVEQVTVIVRRIQEPEAIRGLFRVSFKPARGSSAHKATHKRDKKLPSAQAHYDKELTHTRESLRGTTDALQTSNEELKSVNEELQSTNEELQSTNEELETSKEEMQALNEELQTLNAEQQLKVDELAQLNDDMQNLLNGTDIATVFLDRELKIKRFTEQARRVVRLITTDVGRPIGDLVPQVHYDQLTQDAMRVLSTLQPHEAEVQTLAGRWLLVRILPYRTAQNVIDGVVITFVDIDRLKRAEGAALATC